MFCLLVCLIGGIFILFSLFLGDVVGGDYFLFPASLLFVLDITLNWCRERQDLEDLEEEDNDQNIFKFKMC